MEYINILKSGFWSLIVLAFTILILKNVLGKVFRDLWNLILVVTKNRRPSFTSISDRGNSILVMLIVLSFEFLMVAILLKGSLTILRSTHIYQQILN